MVLFLPRKEINENELKNKDDSLAVLKNENEL